MNHNKIPVEILFKILLKTDSKTVGACRRVCKYWKKILDSSEYLWEKICTKDFPYSSKIAKDKTDSLCTWYHICRNLVIWSRVNLLITNYCIHLYVFPLVGLIQKLDDLELRKGNNKNLKYANNDYALILLYNLCLRIIRPVDNEEFMSEKSFLAVGFSLYNDKLYYYIGRDVYACDLLSPNMDSTLVLHCGNEIKEITHFDGKIMLFTCYGNVVTLSRDYVSVKQMACPPQWKEHIKHICAINEKNYIFYSRDLFSIKTEKANHLYLDFRPVTALFFYDENILMADLEGYIWLYKTRVQRFGSKPIMELITKLPENRFAIQLDVIERQSGPNIIAKTCDMIYIMAIKFFPEVSCIHCYNFLIILYVICSY